MSQQEHVDAQEDAQTLTPPQCKFILGDGNAESRQSSSHSRNGSVALLHGESPSLTPRTQTFGNVHNPFSPPGSIINFGSTPGITPNDILPHATQYYPFPDMTSRASRAPSVAEFARLSSSRPSTADLSSVGSPRASTTRLREAFTSPPARPLTIHSSLSPLTNTTKVERERPKSTMLSARGPIDKPWIKERDPYSSIAYYLTYAVAFLGIIGGALRCYFGWNDVSLMNGNLCLVLDENFESEEGVFGDNGKFFREVDMSGFGNGEFEMTTASRNNSFVANGHLYIVPTLTADNIGEAAIEDGFVYNITGCTYNITHGSSYTSANPASSSLNTSLIGVDADFNVAEYYKACSAVSNSTSGQTINPVQSARISTRKSASIKFGRIEVRAKIPTGDWIWPAIWMLPVDDKYGPWPLSGEIDIMEARGNGPRYPRQGSDWVRGSLNWGPVTWLNAVAKTFGAWKLRRGSYSSDFHTYALEWQEDFIRIYVDTRLHHTLPVLKTNKQSFWERGNFPPVIQNGSQSVILENPWINGTNSAPFDQPFYLILNVAVGGTNGWFPDRAGDKPWLDQSQTPMLDFWKGRTQWLPTWPTTTEDRAMVVDSVKMWQKC